MNILPLGNQVLVKPLQRQERTTGGIIIPGVINKELEEGEVVAIATAIINVKPGDKILYSSRVGVPLLLGDTNYKFLNGPTEKSEGDIKAII